MANPVDKRLLRELQRLLGRQSGASSPAIGPTLPSYPGAQGPTPAAVDNTSAAISDLSQPLALPQTRPGMIAPVSATELAALGNIGKALWAARLRKKRDAQSRALLEQELAAANGTGPLALQPVNPGSPAVLPGPGAAQAKASETAAQGSYDAARQASAAAEIPHDVAALADQRASPWAMMRIAKQITPSPRVVQGPGGSLLQRDAAGNLKVVLGRAPQRPNATLAPGSELVGPNGTTLAQNSSPSPNQPLVAIQRGGRTVLVPRSQAAGASPPLSPRDARIADLEQQLTARGMNATKAHNYAVNVADGNLKMSINPATGAVDFTDLATGTAHEVPFGSQSTPVPTPAVGQTLWDAATLGTGPISGLAAGISDVSGMFGGPIATKTIEARQRLKLGAQAMTRALANNPRFPIAERKWIQDELSLLPGLVDNPAAMRARMQTVDSTLRTWLAQSQRVADDPNMPVQTRQAQKQKVADIQSFLAQLGVPQGTSSAGGTSSAASSHTGLPEGWSVRRVK